MRAIDPPPDVLCLTRVLAYAPVDQRTTWTGRPTTSVGGKPLGAVPRLAIGQQFRGDARGFMLMFCDEDWNVITTFDFPDEASARNRAERCYVGVSDEWVETSVTEADAHAYVDNAFPICIFCKTSAADSNVEWLGRDGTWICGSCVREFHKVLESPDTWPSPEPGAES